MVSFDEPAEPKCDMIPRDCSVEACLALPECAQTVCTADTIYYDSPPSCEEGEMCILSETDGPVCYFDLSSDEADFYESCDVARCPFGSFCVKGMVGSGLCVPYCNAASHPRCPEDGKCYNTDDSASMDICFRDDGCDPVKDSGCSGGKGCYLIYNNDTSCLPSGGQEVGQRCKIAWDCVGGSICSEFSPPETTGTCLKVCQNQDDCLGMETCVIFGFYGICQPAVEVK